jgi:hypothetical protein
VSRHIPVPLSDAVGREPHGWTRTVALTTSFGAWTDRDLDGETYVDTLRNGTGRRFALASVSPFERIPVTDLYSDA